VDEPGFEKQPASEALMRLFAIARGDTGQSRRVADFLLAWYNAAEKRCLGPDRALEPRQGHHRRHTDGARVNP
jgi:hypothetical protein